MNVRNGTIYEAAWETSVTYFLHFNAADRKVSSSMKMAKMLASTMHVPVAVLADDTLDWMYKLTRLITPKEFKQCGSLLDMFITNLQDHPALSEALQQAYYLRGAWCNLAYMQRQMIYGQELNPQALHVTRSRILDHLTAMLNSVRE